MYANNETRRQAIHRTEERIRWINNALQDKDELASAKLTREHATWLLGLERMTLRVLHNPALVDVYLGPGPREPE